MKFFFNFSNLFIFLALLNFANNSLAFNVLEFQTKDEKRKFFELAQEIRCMQCDNQSILDSNSYIAEDMRLALLQEMRKGKNSAEIKDYFKSRFGDAVLYSPPLNAKTWVLWGFAPSIFLIFSLVFLWRFFYKKNS